MTTTAITRLDKDARAAVRASLESLGQTKVWTNRDAFDRDLGKALAGHRAALKLPARKLLMDALSEPDLSADPITGPKGQMESDPALRDTENVPLTEDIHEYFDREVKPYVPDAWIDEDKMKIGYEIPFTRHFYRYAPPRPLAEIDAEIQTVIGEIEALFAEVRM